MDLSTGIISTIASNGYRSFAGDGGAAVSSSLNYPNSVWGNTLGVLFIADTANKRVRLISLIQLCNKEYT